MEWLEPRLLLSGATDEAMLGALAGAMRGSGGQSLAAFAQRLTDDSVLGQDLALIGDVLGDQYSPQAQITSLLGGLGSSFAALGDLVAALNGLTGVTVAASRTLAEGFEIDLQLTRTVSQSIAVPDVFDSVGLELSGTLNASIELDFALTVGVFCNTSNVAVPYVVDNAFEQLEVRATIAGQGLGAMAQLGFIDVNLSNVDASTELLYALELVDPGVAGEEAAGQVTFGELTSTPITTLISSRTPITVGAPHLDFDISNPLVPGFTPNLSLDWPDALNPSSFTHNIGSLGVFGDLAEFDPASIVEGLAAIASFAGVGTTGNGLMGFNFMGRPLPLIGPALMTHANIGSTFQTQVINPIGTFDSVDNLRAKLAAIGPSVTGVVAELVGNELTYSFQFSRSTNVPVPIMLGLGDTLDIDINANVTAALNVQFGVVFGVNVTNGQFFMEFDAGNDFSIAATVNAPDIDASATVGFLGLTVTNGTGMLSANVTADINAGADNRLTVAELTTGQVGDIISLNFGGSASASLPLSSNMLEGGGGTLTIDWTDLNDLTTLTTNAASFLSYNQFTNLDPSMISNGLTGLGTVAGFFSALDQLSAGLAMLGVDVGDIVDLGDVFNTQLLNRIRTLSTPPGQPPTTTLLYNNSDQLLSILRTAFGAGNVDGDVVGDEIVYQLAFTHQFNRTFPVANLGLNQGVGPIDLGLDFTANVQVQVGVSVDIEFGLNATDGDFFVTTDGPDPEIKLTLLVNAPIMGSARLGFLDVTIGAGGGLKIFSGDPNAAMPAPAMFSFDLEDPGTDEADGRLTLDEIPAAAAALGDVVTLTTDVSGRLSLPLSTTLPGFVGGPATLIINWADALNPAGFVVENPVAAANFLNFNSITPSMIVSGLAHLVEQAASWMGDDLLGLDIPLVGAKLQDLVNLLGELNEFMNRFNGPGAFDSAQTLVSRVPGMTVNATAQDVRFTVNLHEMFSAMADAGFGTPLDNAGTPVSFDVNTMVTLSAMLDIALTFGARFNVSNPLDAVFLVTNSPSPEVVVRANVNGTVNAQAELGLFTVNVNGTARINDGTTPGFAQLKLDITEPSGDGLLTISELLANPLARFNLQAPMGQAEVDVTLSSSVLPGVTAGVNLLWTDLADLANPDVTVDTAELAAFFANAANFDFNTARIALAALLGWLGDVAGEDILNAEIPVIGQSLNDILPFATDLINFFTTLRNSTNSSLTTAGQFSALVQDLVDDAMLPVSVIVTPVGDGLQFDFSFSNTLIEVVTWEKTLGGSIAALDLEIDLAAQLTYGFDLGFGFNSQDGFYLVDYGMGADPELRLDANVSTTFGDGEGITGNFLFLELVVGGQDAMGNPAVVQIGGGLDVDLRKPGAGAGGGRIKFSELTTSFNQVVNVSAELGADVYLPMTVYLGDKDSPNSPNVTAVFEMHWRPLMDLVPFFGPLSLNSHDIVDAFPLDKIELDFGRFVCTTIAPIVQKIHQFYPVPEEVSDLLNTNIPFLDAKIIEFLDLPPAVEFLLVDFPQILAAANDIVSAGCGDGDGGGGSSVLHSGAEDGAGGGSDGAAGAGSDFEGFTNALRNAGFSFPVLDDFSNIVKLLLGQDIDLIIWDPGKLEIGYDFSIEIPLLGYGIPFLADVTINLFVGGAFSFGVDLVIGLDTRGLRHFIDDPSNPGNLLDGFFFGDNHEGNVDNPEVFATAEIFAGINGKVRILGFDIAEIYGKLGVQGIIGLNLNDINLDQDPDNLILLHGPVNGPPTNNAGDNRIHLDEIAAILQEFGFACLFDLHGEINLFFEIGFEIDLFLFSISDSFRTTLNLINFNISCDDFRGGDVAQLNGATNALTMTGVEADNLDNDQTHEYHVKLIDRRQDDFGNPLPDLLRVEKRLPGADPMTVSEDFILADVDTLRLDLGDGDDKVFIDKDLYGISRIEINGEGGNDEINIPRLPGLTEVIVNGGDGDDLIFGDANGAGDDDLPILTDLRFVAHGNAGNDTINGFKADGDPMLLLTGTGNKIYGDAGDDTLTGSVGRDLIFAGSGNDVVSGGDDEAVPGANGSDRLFGEGDNDVIYGHSGMDFIDGGSGDDLLFGGDDNDTIFGSSGGDEIHGTDGDDTIDGGGGVDVIFGENGNDNIHGGTENDTLHGQLGDDVLFGDDGDDVINGNEGMDTIDGGADRDMIFGGTEADTLRGGTGDDTIRGSTGADMIFGDDGNDTLYGEADNDLIEGNAGADTMSGGSGDDIMYGHNAAASGDDNAADTMFGDTGMDTMRGQGGNDLLDGGADNDTMFGGAGADMMQGSGGDDTMRGDTGADEMHGGLGDDAMFGGGDGDTMFGDEGIDDIRGEGGGDEIHGGADDDLLMGGAGGDTIFGDGGYDRIYGHTDTGTGDDNAADFLHGNDDDDDLYGQGGNDVIHGDAGRDRAFGGAGNDEIHGGSDNDIVWGEDGDDTITGDAGHDVVYGGAGNDDLSGDADDDRIHGGTGNDVIRGGDGHDLLYGEAGLDSIFGDEGDDRLDGGADRDTLRGGTGRDLLIAGTGVGDILYGEEDDDQLVGSDDGALTDPNFFDATYFGDVLDGGAGDDMIWALGGADFVDGGTGNDTIDTGVGSDFVIAGDGDDWVFAGHGLGDTILGGLGDDELYGSHDGADMIHGEAGNDRVYGQGGNDMLFGEEGDDVIDGGIGADVVSGGLGDDELAGGGGHGDSLDGGAGDDLLRGSDDGGDTLLGGAGRDIAYGHDGNDTIRGGDDDDILHGGAGDDLLEGDGGADTLIGEANHDVLWGHNAAAAGDDSAVDYLYGDFGTNGNEPGSGQDQLDGNGGNDLLFGEGGDDAINDVNGAGNLVDFGTGEGVPPGPFTNPPTATPNPAILPGSPRIIAGSSLPVGTDYRGRWQELAGSASSGGLSGDSAALEPNVAVASDGTRYVAWVDGRHGNYEVYVAVHEDGIGWVQLGGSAEAGGVSNTTTSSRRPALTLDGGGAPVVAWTEFNAGGGSDVRAARWDAAANAGAGAWVALGDSLDGNGLSNTGAADEPVIVNTGAGLVVAWLDTSPVARNVYSRRFNGAAWQQIDGSTTGTGVSGSTSDVADLAIAANAANFAVAWTQSVGGITQVYLEQFNNATGTFQQLSNSATGGGVSNTAGRSQHPSLAYHGGRLYAAWSDVTNVYAEIYAASYNFATSAWTPAGTGANSGGGVSQTGGDATHPTLASGGGQLHLLWTDDRIASRDGVELALYARQWDGSAFIEELTGDASARGVSPTGIAVVDAQVVVNTDGHPIVVWTEQGGPTPTNDAEPRSSIHVRANQYEVDLSGTVYPAGGGVTIQSILTANNLGPGDVILLTGVDSTPFNVTADDAGVAIIGAAG